MPDPAHARYMLKSIYWHAQGGRCGLCGVPLSSHVNRRGVTFDHVWPISRVGATESNGNYLLAHERCNQAKGNRRPNGCELIVLAATNRRLGFPEHRTRVWEAP